MRTVRDDTSHWPVPIVRAAPAVAVGLAITFSANHTASFGLVMFGIFAIATGLVLIWAGLSRSDRVLTGIFLAEAVVALVTGVAALALSTGGLGYLLFLITAFFAITGFLELYAGFRSRGKDASARDWLIIGGFTAVAALVFLLMPLGSVAAVGLFGAYGTLVGLFLIIAGLSLKWAGQDASDRAARSAADAQAEAPIVDSAADSTQQN